MSTEDKVNNTAETAKGKVKEGAGKATGSNHGGGRRRPRAAGGHVIAGHTAVLEDQKDVTPGITRP